MLFIYFGRAAIIRAVVIKRGCVLYFVSIFVARQVLYFVSIFEMADDGLNCVVVIAAAAYLLLDDESDEEKQSKPKRYRSKWVNPWLEKRDEEGVYAKLLPELCSGDHNEQKLFASFIRMEKADFDFLLDLVSSFLPLRLPANTDSSWSSLGIDVALLGDRI